MPVYFLGVFSTHRILSFLDFIFEASMVQVSNGNGHFSEQVTAVAHFKHKAIAVLVPNANKHVAGSGPFSMLLSYSQQPPSMPSAACSGFSHLCDAVSGTLYPF